MKNLKSTKSRFILCLAFLLVLIGLIPTLGIFSGGSQSAQASDVTITDYTVLPADTFPDRITSGPDGNLWFTEIGAQDTIGRITTSGTETDYVVPSNTYPNSITNGPNGNLWFTETSGNKIGEITTSGTVTEYPVPASDVSGGSITSGPDGNIWFTEDSLNKIAKITPSGILTEYAIPDVAGPAGITAGPDGNLWFTEDTGKIGKITTSGIITEYAIPTIGSLPEYITAGPDGNLWFTESGGNNIGKITTNGTITEYAIPTSGSYAEGITAGPDGNLWFTESGGNNIGKITTNGTITEYAIPTSQSCPHSITSGPDGNLWFTELCTNKIGVLHLSGVTPSPTSTRLSLAPASQTATIGGGQGLVTATLLDGATGAPASNVKLSFRVEAGPNAGMSGTCFPSSCTTNANGQVGWSYLGTAIGVDTVQVWMDTNGNGVPDTGEPQTTAGIQWTAATCQDAVFIAATGSDQHYTSDTNLKISPQLNSVYKAMMSRLAGRKSVRVQVLDYPALSVNVLKANLNTGTFSARWHQFFGVNLPKYLAGKDKGVAALWGAVTKVRFTCPNQKIVLAGYSQGAMVVHEFLEELAATNDTATKSAIRGVVLVADPERVKHSQVLEFGDAAWSAMGICNFPGVSRFTSCSGPLQLTDVPAAFRSVTTDVCFQYDIVCDTGELFHDFNVNTQSGYIEAVNLGTFIHTGLYQGSPKTTTVGYRAANLLLASG